MPSWVDFYINQAKLKYFLLKMHLLIKTTGLSSLKYSYEISIPLETYYAKKKNQSSENSIWTETPTGLL